MKDSINVTVAQILAANIASNYLAARAKRGDPQRALEILKKAGRGEPPREGDELPEGWKATDTSRRRPRRPTRKKSPK